jgi:hypothetical protein
MLSTLLLSVVLATGHRTVVDPAPPLVTWEELCEHPSRWLGKTVHLRIQYLDPVERWNPYMTRFSAPRFAGVQAWADEQLPWIRTEYDAPLVRLFTLREGSCAWAFQSARRGDRFEVTAVVREVFLSLPWTEVVEVLPLPERIGEGTVIHAGRALDLMGKKAWKLAELEVDQAMTVNLPERARTELLRMKDACRAAAEEAKRPRRSTVGVNGAG